MTEEQLTTTFVSELERATELCASDLFMISQDDGNGLQSKKIEYSTLCAKVLDGVDGRVDARIDEQIGYLSDDLYTLSGKVTKISTDLNQNISATIKIANCVKKVKEDIQKHQLSLDFHKKRLDDIDTIHRGISGQAGITVDKSISSNWKIKHTNSVDAQTSTSLLKIKYDAQGHITGKENVTVNDLTAAAEGHLLTGVGVGLISSNGVVSLSAASNGMIGGVALGYSQSGKNYPLTADSSSGKAYVNVPWTDTTYSAATSEQAGLIKTGGSFTGKYYPVDINASGYAYVHVPWTDGYGTIGRSKLTADQYSTIVAIESDGGELADLSTSRFIYNTLSTLSSNVYNLKIPELSNNYLGKNNASFSFVNNILQLKLKGTTIASQVINIDDQDRIDSVEYSLTATDGETVYHGHFLVFNKINGTQIFCDLSELLKDTIKNYLSVVTALPPIAQADPEIYYFKIDS